MMETGIPAIPPSVSAPKPRYNRFFGSMRSSFAMRSLISSPTPMSINSAGGMESMENSVKPCFIHKMVQTTHVIQPALPARS